MADQEITDEELRDDLLKRFSDLENLEAKEMFGGYAIYSEGKFFCIVFHGRFYFRVNDRTRPDYVNHGMAPFAPSERVKLTTYFEVPGEVATSHGKLLNWARASIGGMGT